MKEVLQVQGLSKSYGDFQALNNLNLHLEKGEILGIMGPNGAGKSTAIECILGTRKKDKGKVRILGLSPRKDRQKVFCHVGVQFQESSWQQEIRVDELCASIACLYPHSTDWKASLDQWGLLEKLKSRVMNLSGGERQKLSILLASIHNPEILFLDELTTGLDPLARRETWKVIQFMASQGTSILMTSHFMDEVETLCHRGIILKKGKILAEGSIKELISVGSGKNLDESYVNLLGGAA